MADTYIAKIELAVNGQSITDFKSFTEKGFKVRKSVELMNKTGFVPLTPRYGMEVEYVQPQAAPFDWTGVSDGTLTVTLEGGGVIRFTGVSVLEVGDMKADGDNEMVRAITLGAADRSEE